MDLAKCDEVAVFQRSSHPLGDPSAEHSVVLLVQARPAAEGELAVDILKDVEVLIPASIDGGQGEQERDALEAYPGGIVRRVARAHEVDSLAEVRDRPPPEPGMGHRGDNQMKAMVFLDRRAIRFTDLRYIRHDARPLLLFDQPPGAR
ncbi:hypothetical protein WMF31_21360 [Sorangium sp. So ce1036]|uniref:hypothetical protein n=1 Tax=Sorangium sp. So ce1036 TaxID=3133328 RepID=UPI003F0E4E89